ncbi:MAG: isochorismatase family protein [Bryobacterales bacterium]
MHSRVVFSILTLTLWASAALSQIPNPGMEIDPANTALVITDPQNDFLSPDGVTWGVVGKNVTANKTVENIEKLFKTAKARGIPVFVSPHYYYPADHGWRFEGALEALMHKIGMFDRKDALNTEGFEGSGADWLERYKVYIEDGQTIVSSPHKVYGPETNDLVLQLRKRGIDRIILGGMSANLCTESHSVSSWSKASRWRSSATPPPPLKLKRETATKPLSRTSGSSQALCGPPPNCWKSSEGRPRTDWPPRAARLIGRAASDIWRRTLCRTNNFKTFVSDWRTPSLRRSLTASRGVSGIRATSANRLCRR